MGLTSVLRKLNEDSGKSSVTSAEEGGNVKLEDRNSDIRGENKGERASS